MKNLINFKNIELFSKTIFPVILLAIAILFSLLVKDTFYLHIAILTFLYIGLASSWNLISGYAGQLSLGHAAFFGIGGYTSTILFMRLGITPWFGLIAGGILAGIVSLLIGYPSFRLRGSFYTLVTIAFAEVLKVTAINWRSLTEGSIGLHIPFKPGLVNMIFTSRNNYAFLMLCFAVLTILVTHLIAHSKWGFYLIAIRENEDSAAALSINSPKYKSYASFISSFLTAIGGSIYAQYILLVEPNDIFSLNLSIMVALVGIVGGLGTVWGPVLGGVLVLPLSELLRSYLGSGPLRGTNLIIYGLVLMIVAIKSPNGLYHSLTKLIAKLTERGLKVERSD